MVHLDVGQRQQFPACGQHVHEQTPVGQHPDDAEDTDSAVLRELAGRDTR